MGRTFRSGNYQRYVKFGKRTVKDGEAAVIWNMSGESREVVGPRLVRLFYSNIRFMTRHVATRDQYLVVSNRNGEVEHIQGPRSIYENPVRHIAVKVVDSWYLESAAHKIVVYSENKRTKATTFQGDGIEFVEKTGDEGIDISVLSGPRKFMPDVNQTVHTFNWDTSFKILDTSEQPWIVNIRLHSTDGIQADATLVISLSFGMIEKLLKSKNPYVELQNALNADLSAYSNALTWSEIQKSFREDIVKKETLSQFFIRAESIGVEVQNVLLKDLKADRKIAEKMQAKRDAETVFEQERRLALERQKMEERQMEQKQKIERSNLESQTQLIESQQLLARKEKEHALQIMKEENDAKALERTRRNQETLDFLKEMKAMGVNLDTFLTANTVGNNNKSIIIGTPAIEPLKGQVTPSEQTIQVIK